jgi:DNA-binding SARP family transcriptional activator
VAPAKVRVPIVSGLTRPRVHERLDAVWTHGLGLVVAPAGSGKTTLLARFAAASADPVAWYRAESRDESEAALLQHLEAAFVAILPGLTRGWTSVEAASRALEQVAAGRILLVVDDLHVLESSPAEQALERFIDYLPASMAVLIGSRSDPAFNLSRRRVSGGLLEIGPDDLRFRSWEVERLFRDFYNEAVGPEEIARLARRTEGWAAGLQLFHLATTGKSADERSRILAGLGSSSRMVREYLTRNVLAQLPPDLRSFLVNTSVLGILSGPLCDRLLGRSDGARNLEELERRRVFTIALDDDGSYRYHEVLRGHLEGVLLEEQGEPAVRAANRRAGELLEAAEALPEALVAYCRAEAWEAAERLVAREGRQLADGSAPWLDVLPAATLRHDPWLVLASARRHRAEGRWLEAIEAYQRAELGFGAAVSAQACRRERLAIVPWLEVAAGPVADWSGRLRYALSRDPLAGARDPGEGSGAVQDVRPELRQDGRSEPASRLPLTRALALLAGGRPTMAIEVLDRDQSATAAEPALAAATLLSRGAARLLSGDRAGIADLETGIARAEEASWGWLARLGRALLAGATSPAAGLAPSIDNSDPWASGLSALLAGWLQPDDPASFGPLARAAERFAGLGAAALEAWALALQAYLGARAGRVEAGQTIVQAESAVRRGSVMEARYLVELALAMVDAERAEYHVARATEIARRTGLVGPPAAVVQPAPTAEIAGLTFRPAEGAEPARPRRSPDSLAGVPAPAGPGAITVHLFGGFALRVDGNEVDLTSIKPRARHVLHLLGLACGGPVHREVFLAALWPDTDPETAARLLHVAISSLRTALEPGTPRGGAGLIRREGDAYRLGLPPGSEIDLVAFEATLRQAGLDQAQGNLEAAADALRSALERYRGELLPEDGPAEWVIETRDRARLAAVGAARTLAELRSRGNDHAGAILACLRGLAVDRFDDGLWRLLVDAHDRAGDRSAAHRARRGYEQMLSDLGIDPLPEGTRVPTPEGFAGAVASAGA